MQVPHSRTNNNNTESGESQIKRMPLDILRSIGKQVRPRGNQPANVPETNDGPGGDGPRHVARGVIHAPGDKHGRHGESARQAEEDCKVPDCGASRGEEEDEARCRDGHQADDPHTAFVYASGQSRYGDTDDRSPDVRRDGKELAVDAAVAHSV